MEKEIKYLIAQVIRTATPRITFNIKRGGWGISGHLFRS
jgi:hypothetical protein